ncbi:MAG: hypothetical protein IJG40_07765 [Oscillospiraceae bacterium]|nr:hypothetical protein [Oscillospiraceae bacterium]
MKKEYSIVRRDERSDWAEVPTISVDSILWEPDCGVRANGQFCYDEENLYVHLWAIEEHIRAEYTAPLSPVHKDSCLEFFFMPTEGDRYFNFEINPNGCLHIGFGYDRKNRAVLVRRDAMELFQIKTARTPDGWEVFYRIPLAFLRIFYPDFTFSGSIHANVYKCGDETVKAHYLSWNPVTSEQPDFHRPEDFGVIKFT